jgi:hypothetical protein
MGPIAFPETSVTNYQHTLSIYKSVGLNSTAAGVRNQASSRHSKQNLVLCSNLLTLFYNNTGNCKAE